MSIFSRIVRRGEPSLTREQSLTAIPVRNQAVRWEYHEDIDETLIIIPRSDATWVRLVSKIFYVPDSRRVILDELGSHVWRRCDGETTVRDLIKEFSDRFKLSRKEAELSLITFLKQMARRRLIGLAVPDLDKQNRISGKRSKKKKKKKK
ncbi:MAG: PqqD family protein [Planctomycetota bacterium]|nr:PqqD family protein [Planctomycetota bacterium]MDA1142253.1 PqqD family protein [Planctomycetota bacterium]